MCIRDRKKTCNDLIKKGVAFDIIISSDFLRAKQTAKLAQKYLKVKQVLFDKRLREIDIGIFEGKRPEKYHNYFSSLLEKFYKAPPQGESLLDVKKRVMALLKDLERKYQNKKILIVGHEYPLWILFGASKGLDDKKIAALKLRRWKQGDRNFISTGQVMKMNFKKFPFNSAGELDLHKPYIDEIKIKCEECDGECQRISEVIDVWFDSGAMPFAQAHFPFACAQVNPEPHRIRGCPAPYMVLGKNLRKCIPYPADYICEGIDQTRGWFYTLLACATLLGFDAPYRNVLSLNLVLDEKGQKMSKSLGNIVEPWMLIQKYGIDAVRWYFYTINQPWDTKLFREADVQDALRRFLLILWNSFVFWQTYKSKSKPTYSLRVTGYRLLINKWLLARLSQIETEVTKLLNQYDIVAAARLIEKFVVEDISHWYIRRIRAIMKTSNSPEAAEVSKVFGLALLRLSYILAPFTPFIAETIYQNTGGKLKSVHLEDWPKVSEKRKTKGEKLLKQMQEVREIVAKALELRTRAGIKIRQPLNKLKIKNEKLKTSRQLLDLIKDEVNVKRIVFDKSIKQEIELDTTITPTLKEEGLMRELVRRIQDFRKKLGLNPRQKIQLYIETDPKAKKLISKYSSLLKKEISLRSIRFLKPPRRAKTLQIQLDNKHFKIAVKP